MDKIDELLTKGVDQVLPSKEELEKLLRSGKKLRIYQGFDPTSPQLHIGHMIGLRKLRQWQELGHEVIFLIGDFTGRIGDPSGKDETRPQLTKEVVNQNAKTYKEQAGKILDFSGKNSVKIMFNSEWSETMSLTDFMNLASKVTFQQIIERDLYQRRIKEGKDLSLLEILYPLIQGYDSVAMDVDVELGGRDQLFNMMMGRHLMHKMKNKNKFVMTTQLLVDKEGNKVGKTSGNAIVLTDPPEKIFGAVMSFPDEVIINGLECLTNVSQQEIESIANEIKGGKNPIQFKKRLAFEIIAQISTQKEAEIAQNQFEKLFQKGETSGEMPTIKLKLPAVELVDFLVENNLAPSKSEAKRLISQKAVEIDGQTVEESEVEFTNNQVIRVGKKNFVRIILE